MDMKISNACSIELLNNCCHRFEKNCFKDTGQKNILNFVNCDKILKNDWVTDIGKCGNNTSNEYPIEMVNKIPVHDEQLDVEDTSMSSEVLCSSLTVSSNYSSSPEKTLCSGHDLESHSFVIVDGNSHETSQEQDDLHVGDMDDKMKMVMRREYQSLTIGSSKKKMPKMQEKLYVLIFGSSVGSLNLQEEWCCLNIKKMCCTATTTLEFNISSLKMLIKNSMKNLWKDENLTVANPKENIPVMQHELEGYWKEQIMEHLIKIHMGTFSAFCKQARDAESLCLKSKMNNFIIESCQITEIEDNFNPGDRSESYEVCIKNDSKGTLHKGSLQKLKAVILLEMEQLKYLEEKLLERLQKLDSLLKIFSSLAQCGMGSTQALTEKFSYSMKQPEYAHENWDEKSTTTIVSSGPKDVTSQTYFGETSFKKIFTRQIKHSDATLCETASFFSNILLLAVVLGNLGIASGYQVELVPHRAVYFSTSTAVYACHVDNALNVQWYFNGTVEHSIKTIYDSDFGVGILRITNISMKFNSTSIECEGVYSNNGVARSVASFLLLQGLLDLVSNLNCSLVNMTAVDIFWSAPFSLDVSDSNIDIMYCVDIFNSSSSQLLHSDCDISATHYSWEYIPELIGCGWYEIHVKAFNPVGNSTASNITAWAGEYKEFEVIKIYSADKISEYEIELNQDVCPETTELFISNQMISYTSKSLKTMTFFLKNYHHYCDLTIQIMSPYGETIRLLVLNKLKTYDVYSSSIFLSSNNTIGIQSSFILNSSADGVLYALLYCNNGTYDFLKSLFYPVMKNMSLEGTRLPAYRGMYNVLAYDIDSNGSIQSSGFPSTSDMADIEGSLEIEIYENQQCSLDVVGHQVEVKCDCNDTYFQLVIFKRDNSIASKRNPCSKTLLLILNQKESFVYSAVIFIEDVKDGIFISRGSIVVKEFSLQQPTSTNNNKEYSNATIVIAVEFILLGLLILLAIIFSVFLSICRKRKHNMQEAVASTSVNYKGSGTLRGSSVELINNSKVSNCAMWSSED